MRTVWIDHWQHRSGGEVFTIDQPISWSVMPPEQEELAEKIALFGPAAEAITDFEEHHNLIHRTDPLAGSVVSIAWAMCSMVPTGNGDRLSLSPEPGSGILVPRESAPKNGPTGSEHELLGFVVEINELS